MCFGPFKRICNWGPLTALAIIKIITLMTIHCSRQWRGLHANFLQDTSFMIFITLSGSTLYHFINSVYEGPGYLPYNWVPENKRDCQFLQFCAQCQGYKAPRSHHCRKCNRCILKMDHHCPWINNCVGHYNHGYFTAFLASAVAGCCVSTYIMVSWLIVVFTARPLPFVPPSVLILVTVLFSIGLSIGVVVAVGMLLYFQLHSIIKNETGIECWILEKASYRRSATGEQFIHPYSKGWLFNIKQVLSWHCAASGDGIVWPVAEGCDQYTLTREQLEQKKEKRLRAKRYRVVSPASGSWVPISYGLKVLCSPPITEEPRIKLNVGDIVVVTRWRNNWLFGEKENVAIEPSAAVRKDTRVRGWFPRPCAIPFIEADNYFEPERYFEKNPNTENYIPNLLDLSKSTEREIHFDQRVQKVSSTASNKKKHKSY